MLAKLDAAKKVAKHKDEILAIWYASPFVKRVCIAQPLWLQGLIIGGSLREDYQLENYIELLEPVFSQAEKVEELQQFLRHARMAEFARIAWRDMQQYATVQQSLSELSIFAQISIDKALTWCFTWLQSRPCTSEFEQSLSQRIVVFTLGKLGGKEPNFSSDVDPVFAYDKGLKPYARSTCYCRKFLFEISAAVNQSVGGTNTRWLCVSSRHSSLTIW